jgi:16S rRNA (guanine(527)-N(7))-methyltransferase RsmG
VAARPWKFDSSRPHQEIIRESGAGLPICFAFLATLRETSVVREELINGLRQREGAFGLQLSDDAIDCLADYYALVQENNPLLHLVAPCPPGEFAVRHILESLTLLEYLPHAAKFADVGTGAGLPSIPCLLVREDLTGHLIESKEKKSKFLETATAKLGLSGRAEIINAQFEETSAGQAQFVTCRALDKFADKLPRLIKWSGGRNLLLFGGPSLGKALSGQGQRFTQLLMPLSEQRFLLIVEGTA